MRRRSALLMGPLVLGLSMWVYGQAGGNTGQTGGATGTQGSATTQGAQSGQSGEAGAGSVDQPTSQQGANTPAHPGDVTNGRGSANDGGKTLKGCIRSESGMYMLEEKGSKTASLNSGEDLSGHVGHEVKLHGNWQKGGASNAASTSASSNTSGANASGTVASGSEPANASGSASTPRASSSGSAQGSMGASDNGGRKVDHAGKTFQVSSIEMVSETCNLDNSKGGKNSNSDHQGMGQSNQGMGQSSGQSSGSSQPLQR
jgi:hypothetical protein